MKGLILAAGYGTRLYPLTVDKPKPLLPLNERCLIDYLVDKLFNLFEPLEELLVVTNNKFYKNFIEWSEKKELSFPLTIINDGTTSPEDRLGSVGDIHFVVKKSSMAGDLLVMGGDNLFDEGLEEFLKFCSDKKPHVTIGVYDIQNKEEAKRFGVVSIDKNNRVVDFQEKPDNPASSLIAMCLYYFPSETLGYLEEYLHISQKLDKAGDYIRWLAQHKGVYAFRFSGKWYDIGSKESYDQAQQDFKTN